MLNYLQNFYKIQSLKAKILKISWVSDPLDSTCCAFCKVCFAHLAVVSDPALYILAETPYQKSCMRLCCESATLVNSKWHKVFIV